MALRETGKAAEAEPLLREAHDLRAAALPATNRDLAQAKIEWGACLGQLRRYPEAEALLLAGHGTLSVSRDATSVGAARAALNKLVALYQAWGKKDEADRRRAQLAEP